MSASPVCFHCSQPVGDPPQLNRLPDGRRCPTCLDRALDMVAAALPAERPVEREVQGELFPDPEGGESA
jgi:hypothetical protein